MTESADPKKKAKTSSGDLASQLVDLVKSQRKRQTKAGKGTSWIWALFAAAVGFAVVAFLYYRAWAKGKELAKLKHARDVTEQDVLQKQAMDAVVANEEETQRLLAEAAKQERDIKVLDAVIAEETAKKDEYVKSIEKIRNWRDFDDFVGK